MRALQWGYMSAGDPRTLQVVPSWHIVYFIMVSQCLVFCFWRELTLEFSILSLGLKKVASSFFFLS